MDKTQMSGDVQALVQRKVDLIAKIRELKTESAKVSAELVRASSADASLLGLVASW